MTERCTTSAGPPPTASLNSTSPLKHTSSLTTNATPSSEWPGSGIARTIKPAGDEIARDDGDPEPLAELVLVLDVIGVRVRPQQVRRCQPFALDDLEQRPERRAAVDEHGDPAGLVADHVRVRQPALVHRPSDDHAYTLRNVASRLVRLPPMRRIYHSLPSFSRSRLGLLGAGCLSGTETTATPETVVGTLPESTTRAAATCRR